MVDSSNSQLVGTTVAGYRLEQIMEAHVWGPIFLARGPQSAKYMLRFIGEPSQKDPVLPTRAERIVFLGRFQQEANRIATLQDNTILPLVDYGTLRGTPYLVYPMISLPSLRSLLSRSEGSNGQRTSLGMVGRSLEQIAVALSYAHERAVLHHNLSTQCIYIQPSRQLVIGEFGILRIIELSRPDLQKHLGSSESSAPEKLLGKIIDASTDIYAMGAVLYRLLSGHPPFEGHTRADIARQHLYAVVPPLRTWRDDLPPAMDEVVMKALAKDPEQRYATPEELVQAYYQALKTGGDAGDIYMRRPGVAPRGSSSVSSAVSQSGKVPPAYVAPPFRPGKKAPRSRRFIIASLAGLGGLAAIAGILATTHAVSLPGLAPNTNTLTAHPINGTSTTSTNNNQGGTTTGTLIAYTKDVPVNSAKTFPIANQKNPGVLIHLANQSFVAFDSTCTHAGCSVKYNTNTQHLECPCHQAVFDPAQDAAVLSGPAPAPLNQITITVKADGTILANITNNA